MDELRRACAEVASRASHVHIRADAVARCAGELARAGERLPAGLEDEDRPAVADGERLAAHWLQLDAINFGSGWFPTLRKRPGLSGSRTIAAAVREHSERAGPWSAGRLERLGAGELAGVLGQDPEHPLIGLYRLALADLGRRVSGECGGSFATLVEAARGSAVALAVRLGAWPCFEDRSRYGELEVPFLKRAQIAAADLARAGLYEPADLHRLTMFADNLVPHVLRLDGVLVYERELVGRIERGELLEHGGAEEVEIRACALHAVELIVAAGGGRCAAEIDRLLWWRGQQPRYKAVARHRCRCIAY